MKTTVKSERLEALRKRQENLRLSILDEVSRQQKRLDRERAKLVGIVGNALVVHAEQTPQLKTMLRQVLSSAVLDDKARTFLRDRGWVQTGT